MEMSEFGRMSSGAGSSSTRSLASDLRSTPSQNTGLDRESAGWGTTETLNVTLVRPDLVAEVGADVARDSAGRWRHAARWYRARPDLSPADVVLFGSSG